LVIAVFSLTYGFVYGAEKSRAQAGPDSSAGTVADGVAATVNGIDINSSEVEARAARQLQQLSSKVPPQYIRQFRQQTMKKALEDLIIEKLLDEQLKKANITVTEQDVNEQIKEIASQQSPPITIEDFKALVEAHGESFDELKGKIKQGVGYKKLMEQQWKGHTEVTAEEARKYYADNKSQFETPEQIRASHILIKPATADPNTDPNLAKSKAESEAEELLKQIRNGADFAETAKKNSDCPSSEKGGDLGFFEKGRMVPAFEKAALDLEIGQISDIVETRFGYHIIKLTGHNQPTSKTFDLVENDIKDTLKRTKQAEIAQQYIESLKEKADIVYADTSGMKTDMKTKPDSKSTTVKPVK
jgi:peptidyl-prolyl cis-trans isomerase C